MAGDDHKEGNGEGMTNRREQKDCDDCESGFFGEWTAQDLAGVGVDFDHLNYRNMLENTHMGVAGAAQMDRVRDGIGEAGQNNAKRGRIEANHPGFGAQTGITPVMINPGKHNWTIDTLVNFVHLELANILSRLVRLELLVQQMMSRESGQTDMMMSDRYMIASQQHKEITRGHLDRYCLPVLEKTADPPVNVINRIAQELETIYKQLDHKVIVSQVRKWFRKRREEMAARIVSALKRRHPNSVINEREELAARIERDEAELAEIVKYARLEIGEDGAAMEFGKQKILAHLRRPTNHSSNRRDD